MLEFFLAFLGLGAGALLAVLAPDEVEKGRASLLFFYRVLQVLVLLVEGYFLLATPGVGIVFLLLGGSVFLFLRQSPHLFWVPYLVFAIPYFLVEDRSFQLLASSLIFLSGLPGGILLWPQKTWKRR